MQSICVKKWVIAKHNELCHQMTKRRPAGLCTAHECAPRHNVLLELTKTINIAILLIHLFIEYKHVR